MFGAVDRLRIRMELRRVARRLAARPVDHLMASQRRLRADAISELNHYRRRKRLPRNTYVLGRNPVFVDEQGAHCAVAHLLRASDRADLVARTQEKHNLAYVHEMRLAELQEWGCEHGLTVDELAEIQPAYHMGTNWVAGGLVAALGIVGIGWVTATVTTFLRRRPRWRTRARLVTAAVFCMAAAATVIERAANVNSDCLLCSYTLPPTFTRPLVVTLWVAFGVAAALGYIPHAVAAAPELKASPSGSDK